MSFNRFEQLEEWRGLPDFNWNNAAKVINIKFPERQFDSGEALRSWYRRERNKRRAGSESVDIISNPLEAASEAFRAFGASFGTLLSSGIANAPQNGAGAVTGHDLPPALPLPFDPALTLEDVPTLILADIHTPYQDNKFLRAAVNKGLTYGIKQIVIAGDLFNFDIVSRHPKTHKMPTIEQELEIGGRVLLWLAEHAPVYLTAGNHDIRIAAKLDTSLTLARVVAMALNGRHSAHEITVTEYDWLNIGSYYRAGHLEKFSAMPGKQAATIAAMNKRHTFVGHDHIRGVYGHTWIGASIGGCYNPGAFWYEERRLNAHQPMAQGFAIIHDNGFSCFDEKAESYFERYISEDSEWNYTRVR